MKEYKKRLALMLAETGAIFFEDNLILKDGRPTPYFVNMAMFRTGRLSIALGSFLADMMISEGFAKDTDMVLGPSYKGSAIALATAIALWQEHGLDLAFEYDRKEAKTHGEASKEKGLFVNQAFFNECRVFVVDDVATSMGTKYELLEKLEKEMRLKGISYHVVGIGIGIDREQTAAVYDQDGRVLLGQKGKNAIQEFVQRSGIKVYPVAGIREVVEFLFKEKIPLLIRGKHRPLDAKTKGGFDRYMESYGI